MLNFIFVIIMTISGWIGGEPAQMVVEQVVVSTFARSYPGEAVNEDTGLSDAQERFLGQQMYEANNPENKDSYGILDYSGNDLYLHYQKKASERVQKFHSNIENGGL
jgi:hypothetical protein